MTDLLSMGRDEAIAMIRPILQDDEADIETQRLILFNALANSLNADAPDYKKAALTHWVQLARKDPYVYGVLVEVALTAIVRSHPLPAPVLAFVCDVMRGKLKQPHQRGDKHKSDNALRDHRICVAICALKSAGWRPVVRNAASKHRNSACDLVAEVLWPEQDKFTAVQTVWRDREKGDAVLYATPPHWYE